MTKEEMEIAAKNYTPIEPEVEELGGDYYFRCPMLECKKIIKGYDNYCSNCGQRFDWRFVGR